MRPNHQQDSDKERAIVRLDDIKDPKLRQRVLDALGAASKLKKDVARLCPRNRRIRQNHKPLMNKLESEFKEFHEKITGHTLIPQAIKFRLGNGIYYKPDFVQFSNTFGLSAFEVKGPHAFRGGFENLKVAASLYPQIRWILVWVEDGNWCEQVVLP